MTVIAIYLALSAALALTGLIVLAREYLYDSELIVKWGGIEFPWLLVSIIVLWTLPLSAAEAIVPKFSLCATSGLMIVYALWSARQKENDHVLFPTWYLCSAVGYNLGLLGLAVSALSSTYAERRTSFDLQTLRESLPLLLAGVGAFIGLAFGAKAFFAYARRELEQQTIAAIHAHPTCQATFGTISEVHSLEEESAGYHETDILAFWVVGERTSGHLVGRFKTVSDDKEELRDGHIQLENGESILLSGDGITA